MIHELYIFICLFIIGVVLYFTSANIDISRFDSGKPGEHILFISGTHGNEPSGFNALLRLQNRLKDINFKPIKGSITIIHNFNNLGYYTDNRYYSIVGKTIDLNRQYGKNFYLNKKIEKILKHHTLVIDFHEGWGYIRRDKNSIGSSLTPIDIPEKLTNKIIKDLNHSISDKAKWWDINSGKVIPNSLRDYVSNKNKKYILVETSGQNNIQRMSIRVEQNFIVIENILKYYGLI